MMGRVFLIGLLLDLGTFSLLGEHPLRLLLIAAVLLWAALNPAGRSVIMDDDSLKD